MIRSGIALLALLLSTGPARTEEPAKDTLALTARSRQKLDDAGTLHREVEQTQRWKPKETAIIICDMWDQHWCKCATQRVAEMAPKMNAVVKAARSRGVFIIHAPSDCMDFYKDTPQRKLAMTAPAAKNARADVDAG